MQFSLPHRIHFPRYSSQSRSGDLLPDTEKTEIQKNNTEKQEIQDIQPRSPTCIYIYIYIYHYYHYSIHVYIYIYIYIYVNTVLEIDNTVAISTAKRRYLLIALLRFVYRKTPLRFLPLTRICCRLTFAARRRNVATVGIDNTGELAAYCGLRPIFKLRISKFGV